MCFFLYALFFLWKSAMAVPVATKLCALCEEAVVKKKKEDNVREKG